jgi:hypothetical protein
MDLEGFEKFIELFKNVYQPNPDRSKNAYLNCFGYASNTLPPFIILEKKEDKRVLYVQNVSYLITPFSPEKCLENLAEIIQTTDHEAEIKKIKL